MSPRITQSTQTQDKLISRQEFNNTNTQQVEANNPRVINSENTVNPINNDFPIYSRELMVGNITEDPYSKKVNEITKSRIINSIQTINEVFTINQVDVIQYHEEDSTESLAMQGMQGYAKICDSGFKPLYLEIITRKNKVLIKPKSTEDTEILLNAFYHCESSNTEPSICFID